VGELFILFFLPYLATNFVLILLIKCAKFVLRIIICAKA
jgi:hypothetical protein